jgi:hypothetical protein
MVAADRPADSYTNIDGTTTTTSSFSDVSVARASTLIMNGSMMDAMWTRFDSCFLGASGLRSIINMIPGPCGTKRCNTIQ